MVPRGVCAMHRLVAPLAGHQGLPPPRGQASAPEGLLPPAWWAPVRARADVGHGAVLRGCPPFAGLRAKALDPLAVMAVPVLRLRMEAGRLLPSPREAATPCHPWCLPVAPCVSGCQHLEGAVSPGHRRPGLPADLARAGAGCIRQGADQGERPDPVAPPAAGAGGGEPGVLDDAPVCRLL